MEILTKIEQESGEHFFERILGPRRRLPETTIIPFRLKPREITELSQCSSLSGPFVDVFLLHAICDVLVEVDSPEVLFINCRHKIKVQDFATILQTKHGKSVEELAHSMKKLHVMNVFSLEDFYLAFPRARQHLMANKNISFLAMDSINAFYHLDRLTKQQSFSSYVSEMIVSISKLVSDLEVCGIYGKQELFVSSSDGRSKKKGTTKLSYRLSFEPEDVDSVNTSQILVQSFQADTVIRNTLKTHNAFTCRFIVNRLDNVKMLENVTKN